ncbi:MAG: hypothetical protein LBV23_03115 [Deltaproteobacteria bacterium]|jgi:hypothetical protein|nr:hypothetical protein [Deltaproteobacteria bacterium]
MKKFTLFIVVLIALALASPSFTLADDRKPDHKGGPDYKDSHKPPVPHDKRPPYNIKGDKDKKKHYNSKANYKKKHRKDRKPPRKDFRPKLEHKAPGPKDHTKVIVVPGNSHPPANQTSSSVNISVGQQSGVNLSISKEKVVTK